MAREMKDSGIKWFGQIPINWKLVKVKKLFSIGRGRVIATTDLKDTGYPVYSSQTKNNGVLGYIDTYDFNRSQLTWTTDGANAGTVFLREGKHNCTNVCGTLMPKNDGENDLKFLKYMVSFTALYHKRADINGFKIMNNEMADITILLPAIDEQQRIANYLDTECSRIDSVIEQTRASIEEYKKLKQAVITQAVTKGIKPNREMKDSGIEWVGEINTSFTCRKLKTFTDVISKGATPKDISKEIDEHYCIRFLKSENIVDNQLKNLPEFGITSIIHETELKRSQLREDDILFVIAGASIGKTAIMKRSFIPANTNQAMCFIRIKSDYNAFQKYIWFVLQSDLVKKYISLYAVQSAQPNLSMENLGEMRIPYPNDYDELITITKCLDETSLRIDNLINNKLKLLCELEAYKKSLIFEYVTGKKEVIS